MPMDAVFCDQSRRDFNEFIPVDLLFGPYLQDLQSSAAAVATAAVDNNQGVQAGSHKPSLVDDRASSGQSVTEPFIPSAGPTKLPRWKTRTAEQYVAHRRNQHKYREREKQRVQELSSTFQTLAARVQEQAMQDAETDLLQWESDNLQKMCRELDAELAAVQHKADVAIKTEGSSPESLPASEVAQSSGETIQGSLQSSTIPCNMADPMQQHHTMYEAYEFLVNDIKRFLESLGLWPIKMTGSIPDVTAETADKIHDLMKDLMTVCMEMCRLSNCMRQDVRSYLTATAEELDKSELCLRPLTFNSIVDQLQLSEQQKEEMLAVRKTWRDFLARVYNERQQLNQQIIAQLTGNAAVMEPLESLSLKQQYITPHSRANIVHADRHQQPPQELVACPVRVKTEHQATDTDMASTHGQLPDLLAKLEHNLEEELRHISEQDYVTLTKMLKPVQAAWFIVLAYPEHCDCLALLNAVQRKDDE
ncbi:hypothetical protein ABBQ32_010657 [Trebouxia sp. C0010 RCD-2024]